MKDIPLFDPLLPQWAGGLVQTIAANAWRTRVLISKPSVMHIALPDGDSVSILKNAPDRATGRAVLIIHGLGGSAHDPIVRRATAHFLEAGCTVYRMNHRGVADGRGNAQSLYHAGRHEDVAYVVEALVSQEQFDALGLVAYSLSGNMVLHYLGREAARLPSKLRGALCLCPVVDIERASFAISQENAGILNRFFMRAAREYLKEFPAESRVAELYKTAGQLRRLCEVEELLVAPLGGYGTALNYYRESSALPYLSEIRVPTYIVSAEDDPIAVTERTLDWGNANISLLRPRTGGHLGFLSKTKNSLGTRFWLDEATHFLMENLWGVA